MTQKEWLDLVHTLPSDLRSNEEGRRLGLILDIIAEAKKHVLDLEAKIDYFKHAVARERAYLEDARATLKWLATLDDRGPVTISDRVEETLERIGRE